MSKDIEGLNISVKSLLSAGAIIFLLIGEYVVLHKEIEDAKRLPIPELSIEEYEYDKKYLELEIESLKEDIEQVKKRKK